MPREGAASPAPSPLGARRARNDDSGMRDVLPSPGAEGAARSLAALPDPQPPPSGSAGGRRRAGRGDAPAPGAESTAVLCPGGPGRGAPSSSSAPHRLGRRAVCVAAAAPAFLRGGEESKGAGVWGGLSVPSVTPAGVARRLVRVRCAYAAARLSRRAGAVPGAEAAELGQRRCCPVTPAAAATCQSMRSPSSSCKYYPLALNMHLKHFLGQLGKCPKMRVS